MQEIRQCLQLDKIHLNKYKVAVSLLFIFFSFYMTLIHYHVRSQLAHFGIGL